MKNGDLERVNHLSTVTQRLVTGQTYLPLKDWSERFLLKLGEKKDQVL